MSYFKGSDAAVTWYFGLLQEIGKSGFNLVLVAPDLVMVEKVQDHESLLSRCAKMIAQAVSEISAAYTPHTLRTNDPELALAVRREVRWLDVSVEHQREIKRLEQIRKYFGRHPKSPGHVWRGTA
jgi:hypothetical protein